MVSDSESLKPVEQVKKILSKNFELKLRVWAMSGDSKRNIKNQFSFKLAISSKHVGGCWIFLERERRARTLEAHRFPDAPRKNLLLYVKV